MKNGDLVLVSDRNDNFRSDRVRYYVGALPNGGHVTCNLDGTNRSSWDFVRAVPKKVFKPWDEHTAPDLPVVLRHTDSGRQYLVITRMKYGYTLGGHNNVMPYERLHAAYEHLVDGKWLPCGVEVEV